MKRWYDKHPKLARCLECLKEMESKARDRLVQEVIELINSSNARHVMEDFVMEFPLDIYRRRWYDQDPYLWLIFNSLRYADKVLLGKVTKYLQSNIEMRKFA